eukprot:258679_1
MLYVCKDIRFGQINQICAVRIVEFTETYVYADVCFETYVSNDQSETGSTFELIIICVVIIAITYIIQISIVKDIHCNVIGSECLTKNKYSTLMLGDTVKIEYKNNICRFAIRYYFPIEPILQIGFKQWKEFE